jgi:hypothetical protein
MILKKLYSLPGKYLLLVKFSNFWADSDIKKILIVSRKIFISR